MLIHFNSRSFVFTWDAQNAWSKIPGCLLPLHWKEQSLAILGNEQRLPSGRQNKEWECWNVMPQNKKMTLITHLCQTEVTIRSLLVLLWELEVYLQGGDPVIVQRGHLLLCQGNPCLVIDLKPCVELQHVQQLQKQQRKVTSSMNEHNHFRCVSMCVPGRRGGPPSPAAGGWTGGSWPPSENHPGLY